MRDWDIFLDFGRRLWLWWVKTDDTSLCDDPKGRTPGTGEMSSGGIMEDKELVLALGREFKEPVWKYAIRIYFFYHFNRKMLNFIPYFKKTEVLSNSKK